MAGILVGVISDTHGLMRPEAIEALRGASMLLHAGDVGKPEVLGELGALAPVTAIRGNVDQGLWCASLPETTTVEVGGVRIHMLHDRKTLAIDPVAEGIGVVISGHTHQPLIEELEGVLYLNPGAAGPRRFSLPVTVALMRIEDGRAVAELVDLPV
jgi:hypothetical protein